MKIVTLARTRDNANQVEQFCLAYQWTDAIILADGGSEDDTIEIAKRIGKVHVYKFKERVYRNGYWRNPHGMHINYLLDVAEDFSADWVIFDDVDCIPNYHIKKNARSIIEENKHDVICATRIYIKGRDKHYPKLAKPINNDWSPSLWAWKLGKIRALENDPFVHEFTDFSTLPTLNWMPPACLLHYFYPDEETMNRKLNFYVMIKERPEGMKHPDKSYARGTEDLPEWAHE